MSAQHRRRRPPAGRAPAIRHALGAALVGAVGAATYLDGEHSAAQTPVTVAASGPLSAVAPDPAADRHVTPINPSATSDPERLAASPLARLLKGTEIADRAAVRDAVLRIARADGARDVAVQRGRAYVGPTFGVLTSATGPRWGTTHEGVDIANRVGTPIYAVTDGVVVDAGPAAGFGLWVRIRHPDGYTSISGHIDQALVRVGQRVNAGQKIALMGNRGRSTGPHLHIEITDAQGRKVDPQAWLAARGVPPP